ncbi:sodium:calcium antiporter [Natrialba aegyptia]|uniref:Sodium/calcium exchanger membrane protein n=1 Tax=Natrialba aegyptia DSM 13077 TaxID=1227491 RepID=M0AZP0_9EURY|nr:sodium:calcium antiporter [Natrialba aegyptia]ELZ04116.1 sodium/calcium exchanger membrane protein [Natrialba aegyptia DSM 13077]
MVAQEAAFLGLFFLGVVTVVYSVEVFIDAVARSAVSLGVSGFFLAVVLAGVDLENGVLGVTAAAVSLPDLALGTVFGEALFVLAVAVGIAGLLVPFRMDVPTVYIALLVLAPLPAFVFSLGGTIDRIDGVALTLLFVPLLVGIYWYERRSETTYLLADELEGVITYTDEPNDRTPPTESTDGETPVEYDGSGDEADGHSPVPQDTTDDRPPVTADEQSEAGEAHDGRDFDLDEFILTPTLDERSGAFALGVAVVATVGLTAGSLLTVLSAEAIFVAFGISELAFGATVLSFVASIEELALTVEPVRRGRPELAVGNIVGSTVFYVTANAGLIAALHSVETTGAVMTVHWPVFLVCLFIVTSMLARGRVTRLGGAVLLVIYGGYWALNYTL